MDAEMKKVIARIEKLEKAVFGTQKPARVKVALAGGKVSGPAGGLKLLISKGFFNSKRNLEQAKAALTKENFNYSVQAVNTALTRLAKLSGPLVSLRENNRKYYVIRK